jgi:hypothetical protein
MVTNTGNGAVIVTDLTIDHGRGLRIDPRDLCILLAEKLTSGQNQVRYERVRLTIEELDD